jgi:nicotinate phosphoribosyltransferase
MSFLVPSYKELKKGKATDVYFANTHRILKGLKRKPHVVMEVFCKQLPNDYNFGVLFGMQDVAELFRDKEVNVKAMEDGEIFFPWEPVLQVEGRYTEFDTLETICLGFLCKTSGIASKAARVRIAAKDKLLLTFGSRRQHPYLAMISEIAAYVAGFDGVSNTAAAQRIGIKPRGTMPHSLVICLQSQREAFKAYDRFVEKGVPRIMLIDTYSTPKEEGLVALEALGKKLDGVRIDSGNLERITKELKWEFGLRGRKEVKFFLSGGLDEYKIAELADLVDGFGVGTNVSDARTIDFGMKIVELEGKPAAKYGNLSMAKQVYRNWRVFKDVVRLRTSPKPRGYESLLKDLVKNGKVTRRFNYIKLRKRFLRRLRRLPPQLKSLNGRVKFEVLFNP